ncbi:MAG: hypothetical protein ALAOOOJD_01455 [bacterium]|nr:hypothetical protein [bacterium]
MLRFFVSPFRARLWLFGSAALVLVFFLSSCCPPALSQRPVEKNARPAAVEKKIP